MICVFFEPNDDVLRFDTSWLHLFPPPLLISHDIGVIVRARLNYLVLGVFKIE